MEFGWAIYSGFTKYAQFRGWERPREYAYWLLFIMLGAGLFAFLDAFFYIDPPFVLFYLLAITVPTCAITARRLHDVNRTGWWTLAILVPVVGYFILYGFAFKPGDPEPNRYGAGGSARRP